jgi:hypothetical protein
MKKLENLTCSICNNTLNEIDLKQILFNPMIEYFDRCLKCQKSNHYKEIKK